MRPSPSVTIRDLPFGTRRRRSLELRAAISMHRLWSRQNKRKEAHRILADVYGWFTEGFNTPDLVEARRLLHGR